MLLVALTRTNCIFTSKIKKQKIVAPRHSVYSAYALKQPC